MPRQSSAVGLGRDIDLYDLPGVAVAGEDLYGSYWNSIMRGEDLAHLLVRLSLFRRRGDVDLGGSVGELATNLVLAAPRDHFNS
jgi:hypothetical protein